MVIIIKIDVKLNETNIIKYLKLDNELDSSEEIHIQKKIKKLSEIKKMINFDSKLGII